MTRTMQIVTPVAYGLCPDGTLEGADPKLLDLLAVDVPVAAQRHADRDGMELVGEPRFVGQVEPLAGFEDSEGLTWLAWECDAESQSDGSTA